MKSWSLTLQLSDAATKKLTSETIKFESRFKATEELQKLDSARGEDVLITIENEAGEIIGFRSKNYVSHSLSEWTDTESLISEIEF